MSHNIDRKVTFAMANQPGIANQAVSRSMLTEAVRALGLDPNSVLELHSTSDEITITALLKSTDGARALGAPAAVEPEDKPSGYLKHTYTVRVCDDAEADMINELRNGGGRVS
jgi:hypothetical protein